MSTPLHNLSQSEQFAVVESVNAEASRKLIPTISLCVAISAAGTAGNVLSIYIFVSRMKMNAQNDLFIVLSVMNLIACVLCLPMEVLAMRNMYIYPSVVLCKLSRFLNIFTMVTAALILTTLAMYRLRAALSGSAVNIKRSWGILGMVVQLLFSASISWIAAVVFGARSSPTFVGDIVGRDCSVADNVTNTAWPTAFNAILVAGFTLLLTTTIISYYRIGQIVKQSRKNIAFFSASVSVIHCPESGLNKEYPKTSSMDSVEGYLNRARTGRDGTSLSVIVPADYLDFSSKETLETNIGCSGAEEGLNSKSSIATSDRYLTEGNNKVEGGICGTNARAHKSSPHLKDKESSPHLKDKESSPYLTDKQSLPHPTYKSTSTVVALSSVVKLPQDGRVNYQHLILKGTTPDERPRLPPKIKGKFLSQESTQKARLGVSRTSLESAINRTACLLTMVFLVSYVPFFVVSIPRAMDKNTDYTLDTMKLNLINTAVRLYFIMPALSPVIFWASNMNFRRKCRNLCKKK